MRLRNTILLLSLGLTCFSVAALAQVGGTADPVCTTNVTVTPNLNGEGYTQLTGDIALVCTGGVAPAVGSSIPTINLTILYNTAVTSRLLPAAGVPTASEALLIIDEPGSGLLPVVPNFGPGAPQNLCTTPATGCLEYVSQASGIPVATDTPQGTSATTAGKNIFQGIVSANSVTFYGIPMLAPGQSASRVFRITNVRVNANPLAGGSASGAAPVTASISTSGATVMLSNATPTVGFVSPSLTTAASPSTTFQQCASQTRESANILSFTEGFGTAFKTRVLAMTNIANAGQSAPGINGYIPQNVPGGIYNSQSGFVVPIASGQTAGLSDFGTRLKAVFNNVPAGVRIFVSVANVQNNGLPITPPAVIGGSAGNSATFAQLTNGEAGQFAVLTATSVAPGPSGTVPVTEIPIINGSGQAVWEVVNTNPNSIENINFGVYTTYAANPGQNSPPPGTATVNLSYAATPPVFTAGAGSAASDTLPLPRFIPDSNAARNLLTIVSGSCGTKAVVTTPPPGSTLSGSSATFTWTAGSGASAYWLDVGTVQGQGNIFGQNVGLTTSQSVSGIPTTGGTIYVRLWTQFSGNWSFNDYTYSALAGSSKAVLIAPTPGSTLSGSTATFVWAAGIGASAYWLDVGTVQGQGNIFGQNIGLAASQSVNGIPTTGSTIYVRLWTQISGNWSFNDYAYTAAAGSSKAGMSTPAPGSTLNGSTATFTWTAGSGASAYWLDVGTVQGQGNIFGQNVGLATSQSVNGIPTNGSPIYVRLWTQISGNWSFYDYIYTAAAGSSKAVLSTPAPGSTLSGSSATFTWTAGIGASAYWLDVGTVQGQGNIFGANVALVSSQSVSGIPTNGSTIYVRLWTQISGTWSFNDYTYTGGSQARNATMSWPPPGSTLGNSSVTFDWDTGIGASAYWLDVGTIQGQGNVFGSNVGLMTSQSVSGIPTNGSTIYVRLWTQISGTWTYIDYVYTAL